MILFENLCKGLVDGEDWITLVTYDKGKHVSQWLRKQDKTLVYEHTGKPACDAMFDVHSKIYSMMVLKFQ